MASEILIEHATIVTMNPARDILHDASLAISGSRIAALGAAEELRLHFPQARRIDATGKWITPGLIDGGGQDVVITNFTF